MNTIELTIVLLVENFFLDDFALSEKTEANFKFPEFLKFVIESQLLGTKISRSENICQQISKRNICDCCCVENWSLDVENQKFNQWKNKKIWEKQFSLSKLKKSYYSDNHLR